MEVEVEVEVEEEVEGEGQTGEGEVREMDDPAIQAMLAVLGPSALEAR